MRLETLKLAGFFLMSMLVVSAAAPAQSMPFKHLDMTIMGANDNGGGSFSIAGDSDSGLLFDVAERGSDVVVAVSLALVPGKLDFATLFILRNDSYAPVGPYRIFARIPASLEGMEFAIQAAVGAHNSAIYLSDVLDLAVKAGGGKGK